MALSHFNLLRPVLCRSLVQLARCPLAGSAKASASLLCHKGTSIPDFCTRSYATKKSKAKAKGQQPSKVTINFALVEDIISLEEVKGDMAAVLDVLKNDFNRNLSIRTSPGALDHIVVTTEDGKFPLNQLGQISMKTPQLLVVNMTSFPEATAAATRALRESSMKLNPDVDGAIIKVPVPKVTREQRENLTKLAKQLCNKAKDSLRKVRADALSQVKKAKDGQSEDTIRLVEKQLQQMTDGFTADVEKQLAAKTKELLA